MSLALVVYFCQIIGSIDTFFIFLFLFLFVVTVISGIIWACSHDKSTGVNVEEGAAAKKYFFRLAPAAIAVLFVVFAVPSEKTAYTMAAAYATQKVALDPRTQEVGGKVLAIINKKLDIYLTEATSAANDAIEKAAEHTKKNE